MKNESLTTKKKLKRKQAQVLLKQLGSRDAAKAEDAKRKLKDDPEVIDLLSELFANKAKQSKSALQHYFLRMNILTGSFLLLPAIVRYLHPFFVLMFSLIGILLMLILSFRCSHEKYLDRFHRGAKDLLYEIEDIKAIGAHIDANSIPETRIEEIKLGTLTRLLMRLRPEDVGYLEQRHRSTLYGWLRTWGPMHKLRYRETEGQRQFVAAMLYAVKAIGDPAAIKFVEPLAQGKGVAAKDERIQIAAQKCLAALQALLEKQQSALTLLRAADPKQEEQEMLLRPADSVAVQENQRLLRSAPESEEK